MKYLFSFFVLFLFLSLNVLAQSPDDARKLYLEGKNAEALPLLEKLAASRKMPDAYYLLGKIYYSLYEFEKSAAAYTKYADQLSKEKKATDSIAPLIQRAERAARMLSRCEDIQIIDSVIVNKTNFLKAYLLSGESGYLENNGGRVVYENPLRDKRYFAGEKESGRNRLFSEIKLQKDWSDRRELNILADSTGNDDFPFVMPDGLTLYYASTGSASIGGYDLFVTRYHLNNDTYLASNQLGMPFNSIANDYMMAIDEINNIGYFATDRFQPEDTVVVYTFIPKEEYIAIETDRKAELISRAKIVSIRDSWKPDAHYAEHLEQARNAIRNEQTKTFRDFTFVINDDIVYYTFSDFKNDAAKQAFLKSRELEESIHSLEKELEGLRLDYARSNSIRKQHLRSGILEKETSLQDLIQQQAQSVKKVRNFEIKSRNEK